MRILIDAVPLLLRSAGVKNYVYHWIRHLRRLAEPGTIQVYPWLSDLGQLSHEASPLTTPATLARIGFFLFANIRGSPVLSWLLRDADIFHATLHTVNPPRRALLTGTLHDLTCWLMPETHTPGNVKATQRYAALLGRRAAGVIAVSEHTRADAIRLLDFPPEKIEAIPHGIDDAYFSVTGADARAARAKYTLAKPYILFVGTVEPRKNLGTLLDAYLALAPSIRDAFDLVLVGPQGWSSQHTIDRLRSGIPGVRYLGYVPEPDLPGITAGAAAFVYPSLYEGFGFPVAQALAAGVPVVTSNVSALPEVAGSAALLVDPRSPDEIRSALERILLSDSLAAQLREKARRRAAAFTWETCARKSLAFFERLA